LEGQPGTHPQPNIKDSVALPIQILERDTALFRLHQSCYGAIYFNRDNSWRFNNPISGEYGVLYAALDYYAALRETLKPDKFNWNRRSPPLYREGTPDACQRWEEFE
jgi:hypothetical protein